MGIIKRAIAAAFVVAAGVLAFSGVASAATATEYGLLSVSPDATAIEYGVAAPDASATE